MIVVSKGGRAMLRSSGLEAHRPHGSIRDIHAPAATTKVLIAEDETIIRLAAVDAIEEAAYKAVEAADADEAIKALESDSQILVFTDNEMVGSMDGVKVAADVRHRWPPI